MNDVKRCCKQLYDGGRDYHGSPCSKKPTIERDGKWWCSIHDPVRVKAKSAERMAKYNARFAEQIREGRISHAAPEMLELLQLLDRNGGLGQDMHDRIRSVINRATGKT